MVMVDDSRGRGIFGLFRKANDDVIYERQLKAKKPFKIR